MRVFESKQEFVFSHHKSVMAFFNSLFRTCYKCWKTLVLKASNVMVFQKISLYNAAIINKSKVCG